MTARFLSLLAFLVAAAPAASVFADETTEKTAEVEQTGAQQPTPGQPAE